MTTIVLAAQSVQSKLDELGFENCVIGGLAVQVYGEVRTTRDVDFTVLTEIGDEEDLVDQLALAFQPRVSQPKSFALINRVYLGVSDGGVPIDIGLGGFGFEQNCVRNAVMREVTPGLFLRVCQAEDLVVMKSFAGRSRDWDDVEGILARQGQSLDFKSIESELRGLAEAIESMECYEHFMSVKRAVFEAIED